MRTSRFRIQTRRVSKSARELSVYTGIKRLKRSNSKFRPRQRDIILNWGNVDPLPNATYFNPLDAVSIASNKLATFKCLSEAGISVPQFGTDLSWADPDVKVVARTTLTGHSGEGAVVGLPSELPSAPLYVEYIQKDAEYRAIVVGSNVVDIKQKKRKSDFPEDQRKPYIWSHDNGYIFARNDITVPENLQDIAIQTCQALGLRTAALDIIQKGETLYILEANTAYGLEGTTTQLVGDAILNELQAWQH